MKLHFNLYGKKDRCDIHLFSTNSLFMAYALQENISINSVNDLINKLASEERLWFGFAKSITDDLTYSMSQYRTSIQTKRKGRNSKRTKRKP